MFQEKKKKGKVKWAILIPVQNPSRNLSQAERTKKLKYLMTLKNIISNYTLLFEYKTKEILLTKKTQRTFIFSNIWNDISTYHITT